MPSSLPSPAVGDTLSCGHVLTPPASIGTGYARTQDERTLCYPCADTAERADFLNPATSVYPAYVNSEATQVTTWTGGMLGRITSYGVGTLRTTPTGGRYRTRTLRVTAPDGSAWHASGSDNYDVITLRRLTSATSATTKEA